MSSHNFSKEQKELVDRLHDLTNGINLTSTYKDSALSRAWMNRFEILLDDIKKNNECVKIINSLDNDGLTVLIKVASCNGQLERKTQEEAINQLIEVGSTLIPTKQCLERFKSARGSCFSIVMENVSRVDREFGTQKIIGHDGNPFHDPEFLEHYFARQLLSNTLNEKDREFEDIWIRQERVGDQLSPLFIWWNHYLQRDWSYLDNDHMNSRLIGKQIVTEIELSRVILKSVEYLDLVSCGSPLWKKIEEANQYFPLKKHELPDVSISYGELLSRVEWYRLNEDTDSIELNGRKNNSRRLNRL